DAAVDEIVWHLRFREGDGWRKGRARTSDVVRWFEEGLLPDEFFLARAGNRTCRHFRTYPEFRDLKRKTEEVAPAERKRFRLFGGGRPAAYAARRPSFWSSPPPAGGRLSIALAAVLWSLSGLFTRLLQEPTALGLDEPRLTGLQIAFYRALFAGLCL